MMIDPNIATNEELLAELKSRLEQNFSSPKAEERLKLEEDVRRLSSHLRQSERGKSQFLSNVRNEINNPLTSILGLAASIGSLIVDEKVKHMSRLIYQQAFDLDFQMRNIMVAADIEMGEINPMGSQVNVLSLIEDQMAYLRSRVNHGNVEVKLITPRLLRFRTDASLLQTICVNLIANAIEYSGANKMVIIEANEKDGELHFGVTDFGSGIDEEKQKIIFERFQQVETGLTKSHPGHGLGLTIVHELVAILGGSIKLNSSNDKGTTVKVRIPSLPADGNGGISAFGNELIFAQGEEF
jgi:signal transduction histidine kinase